jgi:hypothetical protein
MKNRWARLIISSILIMGLTVPTAAFAGEDRTNDVKYDQEKPSKEEIARKKAQYKVPRSLNDDDVETFLQVESDVWSVLSANLDEDDYGGMYIEDDVLHIKTKKEQKVQSLVSQVKGCVPAKLRSATQKIVYENDCVYTMSELDAACDKIWNAEKNGEVDVVGVGTDEKLNGLIVEAPEWNNEKKQTISDVSGIDMEHLTFEISEGNFEDMSLNDAMAGDKIHGDESGVESSLGCGVYYEIEGLSDEGDGDYGWITSAHNYEDGEKIYLWSYYMGRIDFMNIGPVNDNDYAYADVAVIYKNSKSEVEYNMKVIGTNKLIMNTGKAVQGEDVRMYGATSGHEDGEVISANYQCKWNGVGAGTYRRMIKTDIETANGDSGGPLVRTLDNGQYTLLGIVKGRERSDNQAIFTAWSSIESRLEYGSRGRSVNVWLWP